MDLLPLPQKLQVNYADRIDKYIGDNSDFSRADAQKLIADHAVFVNKINVRKSNFKVKLGDNIEVRKQIIKEIKALPEQILLNIVYEDDDLIVINKASGMVVHPAPGHQSQTLVNALLYHFKELSNLNGQTRPGIVHRIDKDTSGLLVVAKNNFTHQKLAAALKDHKVKRTYLAWVSGRLENEVTHIKLPIGRDTKFRKRMAVTDQNAKAAVTHVFVKKIEAKKTLVQCELETGRTHQIRVHLAYIKHPILGDPLYGKKVDDFGQRLHAFKLEFIHPRTSKLLSFIAEPPEQFNH